MINLESTPTIESTNTFGIYHRNIYDENDFNKTDLDRIHINYGNFINEEFIMKYGIVPDDNIFDCIRFRINYLEFDKLIQNVLLNKEEVKAPFNKENKFKEYLAELENAFSFDFLILTETTEIEEIEFSNEYEFKFYLFDEDLFQFFYESLRETKTYKKLIKPKKDCVGLAIFLLQSKHSILFG